MIVQNNRISWDTTVKHYVRKGLYSNLPTVLQKQIPKTNISRWKAETDHKYKGCQVAQFIAAELALLQRTGQSQNAKTVLEAYFKLSDTYHTIVANVKQIKSKIAIDKEKIVTTIEALKIHIPVKEAIKIFNISRATYQNYKTLVLNKCDASYFKWCLKHYPHQLLYQEINQIKKYLTNIDYKYWSKASVYLLALRNKDVSFCLATFYKYSKLLGFKSNRHLHPKLKYDSLKSYRPNQIWSADVTIYKTPDTTKHYIHFLMDHYSKMILGYSIEKSSSPNAIKKLLEKAYLKHKSDNSIKLVTDGGGENVNATVANFLKTTQPKIINLIAQKDITFSNSGIEALNKVIKHQFLLPQNLQNFKQLETALDHSVITYNFVRPQLALQGNTPQETFYGKAIDLKSHKTHFINQKAYRIEQNNKNKYSSCKI